MSLLTDQTTWLIGAPECWKRLTTFPVRQIFDSSVLAFLDDLSRAIFADREAREYPEVVAFAFWCRQCELAKHKASYADGHFYIGRGLVFHVSPSNVPIMFAYTLAMGLLAGNANIVKLPSRPFPHVEYLCGHIATLLSGETHAALANCIACIRYDRDKVEVTRLLSELCDARVIWGGDATVQNVRQAPLRPVAFDMAFPDRYSIAVIDSNAWLVCKDKSRHIQGFYNDTYLSDHASCASPRVILWLGDRVEAARVSFWSLLEEFVAEHYQPSPAQTVGRLESSYCILARHPDTRLHSRSLNVTRLWCDNVQADLVDEHPGGGVFLESSARSVQSLLPLLQRRCQTISYYGVPVDHLVALLRQVGPRGGDRVVPMGRTLDFSLTWDGYDTIRMLSRKLDIVSATPEEYEP